MDSAHWAGEDGDQTHRTLRQPRAARGGGGVRVHALPGWPLGGVQGAVPRRPQEVRAAAPLNRLGRRLRAWLRVSDAGPGPPPARLGVAEPAPGERQAEAADLCLRRRLQLGQGRGSQAVVKLEGQDPKPRRRRKTTGCKRVDWQGLASLTALKAPHAQNPPGNRGLAEEDLGPSSAQTQHC